MQRLQKDYRRLVIKIGSSLFLAEKSIEDIIQKICFLVKQKKKEVVVVSSGAIFYGMSKLGLKNRPKELFDLQAAAALGQGELMDVYRRGLEKQEIKCAQVLLTWDDFNQRSRYLNAKNTLLTLLKLGIVPIVNENDTVSTEEIKFGDNDHLSALVANLIEADLLLILSDVDGLLDKDKKVIEELDYDRHSKLAYATDKQACVGGMITKVEAAKMATDSGIDCRIINGDNQEQDLLSVAGTSVYAKIKRLPARKSWIAFGTKPKGKIYVDNGAREALVKKFKSLLSPGVIKTEGNFDAGDTVLVVDEKGKEFARGITNCSSDELNKRKGKKSEREVIHRDNLHIKE